MATLTGKTVASTYTSLLKLEGNTGSTVAGASGDAVQVKTGDNDATTLYLNTDRVGINAADPGTLLEVRGVAGTGAASAGVLTLSTAETSVRVGSVDQLGRIDFQAPKEGGGSDAILVGASIHAVAAEDFAADNNSTALVFSTGTTTAPIERVRIDQDGQFGIGVAPNYALTVHTASAGGSWIQVTDSDTGVTGSDGFLIGVNGNEAASLYNAEATDMILSTSGTARATINALGNLGLGDTDPDEAKLSITGVQAGDVGVKIDHDIVDTHALQIDAENTTGRGLDIECDALTTGNIAKFYSNGAVNATARNLVEIVNDNAGATGATALKIQQDSTAPAIDAGAGYMVNEQGRTDHVSNTMSAPFYRFDGVNDHIVIADSPHLSFGDSTTDVAFSITAWINMEDASDFAIISKGTAWTAAEWFLSVNGSDKIDFTVLDQSTGDAYEKAVYDTAITAYEGKWIHIAATYNGVGGASANAGMSLYLNGVSVATTLTDAGTYVAMESGAGAVHIGRYGSDYAQGSISKVRIWNVELDATEVKEDYSGMAVPFKYQGGNETDLVTNGDFDPDSDWTKGTNWTIGSGTANAGNVTGTVLYQDIGAVVGKTFRTKYTVSSYVDGTIHSNIGAYIDGTLRSANGTYLDYFYTKHPSSNVNFYFEGRTAASLSIDNASCVRVGCVAEYDATGIVSDKWFDKSGNELHGVVTGGATTENTAAAPVVSEQHPAFLAIMATDMDNHPTATSVVHKLDDEIFDNGNNFHSAVKTGVCDASGTYSGDDLHDADGGFESSDVGSFYWNSTDSLWGTVTAFVNSGELTISGSNGMANGKTYFLYKSTFTAPVTGKYHFDWSARIENIDTASSYLNWYLQTSSGIVAYSLANTGTSDFGAFTYHESILIDLDANDTVYVSLRQADGTKQMDVIGDGAHNPYTFLSGHLVC